ncbi:MAG: DUF1475 domain-containing protein [Pseudomonadales bacterium]|nr:DUF1475 domain-containing protein [Pseudomonadales bacterium]
MTSATRLCIYLTALLLITLTGALIYAITKGDFATSGPILFGSPWGIMTIVDLYAGFLLFAMFIYATHKDTFKASLWVVTLMLLGNMIACVYLILWLKNRNSQELPHNGLAQSLNKH